MIGDEMGSIRPVAGREHVSHGLDDLAVLSEPPAGSTMEAGKLIGGPSAELQAQEIGQQVVIAKPCAVRVERHHERVCILELQQHLLRP